LTQEGWLVEQGEQKHAKFYALRIEAYMGMLFCLTCIPGYQNRFCCVRM